MSWRLLLHQAVPTWIPCRTHTRSHRKPEARALLPQKQHSCVRMDALTSEEVEHNSLQGPPQPADYFQLDTSAPLPPGPLMRMNFMIQTPCKEWIRVYEDTTFIYRSL